MIIIKSASEIDKMRVSGAITAELMAAVGGMIAPGVTTAELDRAAEAFIRGCGARSAFKGYRGYPASICVSVNEEVVHGIPGRRRLAAGDIVSLDVGVEYDGYFADMARTFAAGGGPRRTGAFWMRRGSPWRTRSGRPSPGDGSTTSRTPSRAAPPRTASRW